MYSSCIKHPNQLSQINRKSNTPNPVTCSPNSLIGYSTGKQNLEDMSRTMSYPGLETVSKDGCHNQGVGQGDSVCSEEADIFTNPNRNEYKPSKKSKASRYKRNGSQKIKHNHDPFVALKHLPLNSVSASISSKPKMPRNSKFRGSEKPGSRRERPNGDIISSISFDLPEITPRSATEPAALNPNSKPSNGENTNCQKKQQLVQQNQHSASEKYQPHHGQPISYRTPDPQCYQFPPSHHQVVDRNYIHSQRGFEPCYTLSPGVYQNPAGYGYRPSGYSEVLPQPLYPVCPFPCPYYASSMHNYR